MSLCFFKQKTAYELRISDWSSDVCSSDLVGSAIPVLPLLSEAGRTAGKKAVEAVVNFILSKLGGSESEAAMAMQTAQKAIESNTEVTLKALEVTEALIKEIGRASCRERVCQYV